MQCARPGYRDLRDQPGVGRDEREVREVDRPRPLHAAVDHGNRLAAALAGRAGLGAARGCFAGDGIDAQLAELAIEKAVIGAAAEFAVGRELEPDALLQRQRLLDGRVFGSGERRAVELMPSPRSCGKMNHIQWLRLPPCLSSATTWL